MCARMRGHSYACVSKGLSRLSTEQRRVFTFLRRTEAKPRCIRHEYLNSQSDLPYTYWCAAQVMNE